MRSKCDFESYSFVFFAFSRYQKL